MKPYWQSADGTITVYHAPFELVLASGAVPVEEVALIHDDPPYGVKERTARASAGRGKPSFQSSGVRAPGGRLTASVDFPPVTGDDQPFDPVPLLALRRPLVLWGANHYADRLPVSSCWLTWDKRDGGTPDDNADAEHAWTNLGGPARLFSHRWRGMIKASEQGTRRLAPTQKPVALSLWVYSARAKLKPGDLVFVPHGGSGPDLPAAREMGLRLIWCDVEEWCCQTAIARLPEAPPAILERAKAFQRATRKAKPEAACGPLFGGAR